MVSSRSLCAISFDEQREKDFPREREESQMEIGYMTKAGKKEYLLHGDGES